MREERVGSERKRECERGLEGVGRERQAGRVGKKGGRDRERERGSSRVVTVRQN